MCSRISTTASFVGGSNGGVENCVMRIVPEPSAEVRIGPSSGRDRTDWVPRTTSGASSETSHASSCSRYVKSPGPRRPSRVKTIAAELPNSSSGQVRASSSAARTLSASAVKNAVSS
jgi:hypothetical protein